MQTNTESNYLTVYLFEKNKGIYFANIPVNKLVTASTIEALAESTGASISDLSYIIIKDGAYLEALEKNDVQIVREVFADYRIPEVKDDYVMLYGSKQKIDLKFFDKKRNQNTDPSYLTIFEILNKDKDAIGKEVINKYSKDTLENKEFIKPMLIPNKTSF